MAGAAELHRGQPGGQCDPALPGHRQARRVPVGAQLDAGGHVPRQVRVDGRGLLAARAQGGAGVRQRGVGVPGDGVQLQGEGHAHLRPRPPPG